MHSLVFMNFEIIRDLHQKLFLAEACLSTAAALCGLPDPQDRLIVQGRFFRTRVV